jgi:hypothetical protein
MEILVTIHDIWRYAVLVAAIGALALSVMAYMGSREWDALTDRFSLFFTIAMDIQVLIGILVWITVTDPQVRGDNFLIWVHPIAMLVAAGLAHMGRALSERALGSRAKGRTATAFFAGSLLVVLVAIPLSSWPL